MLKQGFLNDNGDDEGSSNTNNNDNSNDNDNLGPLRDKRSSHPTIPNRVKFLWSSSTPANQKLIRNSWVSNSNSNNNNNSSTANSNNKVKNKVVSEVDILHEFKMEANELLTTQEQEQLKDKEKKEKEELEKQKEKEKQKEIIDKPFIRVFEEKEEERRRNQRELLWQEHTNSIGGDIIWNTTNANQDTKTADTIMEVDKTLSPLVNSMNASIEAKLSPAAEALVSLKTSTPSPSKIILPPSPSPLSSITTMPQPPQPQPKISSPIVQKQPAVLPQAVTTPSPPAAQTIYTSPNINTIFKKQKSEVAVTVPPPSSHTMLSTETTTNNFTEEGQVIELFPSQKEEEQHVLPNVPKPNNPYESIPTLPHKTAGAPKNALQAYFMQKFSIQLTNENFISRNNAGPPHDMRWTCTFVTPNTNETFNSARYGDSRFYTVSEDNDTSSTGTTDIVWYKKRKLAEHAAAARALDCLMYREFQRDTCAWRICLDLPYGQKKDNEKLYSKKRSLEQQVDDDKNFREDYQALRLGAGGNSGVNVGTSGTDITGTSAVSSVSECDNKIMEEDEDDKFREKYNALRLGENYG